MLQRIWQRLVRLFQRWFGRRRNQTPPPVRPEPLPKLTDADLQFLFTQLIEGVSQGRGQAWALKYLQRTENRVTNERWVAWLRRYGERLLASGVPNHDLARQMVQLGEVGCGTLGEVAQEIGRQLLARTTPTRNSKPLSDAAVTSSTNQANSNSSIDSSGTGEAENWFHKGNEQCHAGNFQAAIASYDQAVHWRSNFPEAWTNRGAALHSLQRYEEAIASYDQALHWRSDDVLAWTNRGAALADLLRYEEAIASYDTALHWRSDDPGTWTNRGLVLDKLQRYEEAIASYDTALHWRPDLPEAWYDRGLTLGKLQRYEEAITSYDTALHWRPDLPEAWYDRGLVLDKLQRYEEAIASYDQAVYWRPDYPEAWNNRGAALNSLQRYEEAIASYD